jgi:hypothetical protein
MRWFILLIVILSITMVIAENHTTLEINNETISENLTIDIENLSLSQPLEFEGEGIDQELEVEVTEPRDREVSNNENMSIVEFFREIGGKYWVYIIIVIVVLVIGILVKFRGEVILFLLRFKDRAKLEKKINPVNGGENNASSKDIEIEMEKIKIEIMEEYPKVLKEDVKKVLKTTDHLLGEMSDEQVYEFVHSEEFAKYKSILKKAYEPLKENKNEVEKLDKVLSLFKKGLIDSNEVRKMLGLPIRNVQPREVKKESKDVVLDKLKKQKNEKN